MPKPGKKAAPPAKGDLSRLQHDSEESRRMAKAVDSYFQRVTELDRHFVPVDQDLLILHKLPDVALYTLDGPPQDKASFKPFRSRGQYLTQEQLDHLFKQGVTELYIERADAPKFTQYIEVLLSEMQVGSPMVDEKKIVALRDTAVRAISDIFESPSPENVQKGIKVVSGFVHTLMSDPKAYQLLLSLSSHDHYTLQHSVGVAANAIIVAKKVGINDEPSLIEIGVGGLLHDIGKTRVHRDIINKKGALTPEEWAEMKKHPLLGYEIVKNNPDIGTRAKLAILQHHEDVNGAGYPLGLSHDQIDLFAKIVTLCDIYNAVTTDRSYSKAKEPFDAFRLIKEKLHHKVDAKLFEAMVLVYGGKV